MRGTGSEKSQSASAPAVYQDHEAVGRQTDRQAGRQAGRQAREARRQTNTKGVGGLEAVTGRG